ncbi:MAG: large subunit ribosomal protein L9 [Oceanicoccus sp.]|jgi:large subunit ribosomal protein L9
MKVVLLRHVKGLGQKGEVKEVNSGYFHNFLRPQKIAQEATDSAVRHIQSQKKKSVEKLENIKESAEAVKEKIEGKSVTISEKVSDSGKLYASVNVKEVAEALKEQLKVSVPAKQLRVPDHIKEVGEYEVKAELHKDVFSNFTLNVTAK